MNAGLKLLEGLPRVRQRCHHEPFCYHARSWRPEGSIARTKRQEAHAITRLMRESVTTLALAAFVLCVCVDPLSQCRLDMNHRILLRRYWSDVKWLCSDKCWFVWSGFPTTNSPPLKSRGSWAILWPLPHGRSLQRNPRRHWILLTRHSAHYGDWIKQGHLLP